MSKQDKAKLVVSLQTYGGFVLDADKALQIMELLRGAENFRTKYNGMGTTLHVFPYEDQELASFRYLTDEQYALAKIAGKPAEP
jgi:hypothetical protein